MAMFRRGLLEPVVDYLYEDRDNVIVLQRTTSDRFSSAALNEIVQILKSNYKYEVTKIKSPAGSNKIELHISVPYKFFPPSVTSEAKTIIEILERYGYMLEYSYFYVPEEKAAAEAKAAGKDTGSKTLLGKYVGEPVGEAIGEAIKPLSNLLIVAMVIILIGIIFIRPKVSVGV